MVDPDRLSAAFETARCDLLAESVAEGHWVGKLASSPLSTATAISALAIVERAAPLVSGRIADEQRECDLSRLIMSSVRWLARHQNADGGWGDTDQSESNIATTMLVRFAFALTAVPADHPGILERADAYIESQGGVRGLRRRYGKDKTFAVPILTNGALAGMVPWRMVPSLPFELACLPQSWWKLVRLPVVSYAIPALVAIGQARYFHRKPWNPLARLARWLTARKSLALVEGLQPASGGFLEAAPLTSFVVMSLASIGQANHPVVRKGVEFLLATVRPDGSWPIDTNLATWNTTLAVNALAGAGEDVRELGCLDWILSCQQRQAHVYTGAAPGGWAWTDCSGGVPDADDTPGALLALAVYARAESDPARRERIHAAAAAGVRWLVDLQNADGGWPTFCRGWGALPFDRSGSDLTAHALRALHAWRSAPFVAADTTNEAQAAAAPATAAAPSLKTIIDTALERGFRFLATKQRGDGAWLPLWFGDQYLPGEENPVYGTAKVLAAYRDLGRLDTAAARRGLDWLAGAAHADGRWGGLPPAELCARREPANIEATALAVETLLSCSPGPIHEAVAQQGLKCLVDAVEQNRHHECSPIGLYFAKLWYYEKLYPLIWTVAALGQAVRRSGPASESPAVVHSGKP
ncbi:MAG: prenyltransferase/squalene oxidase repeat-containing protein [Pirellulales bacterium]